MPKQRATITVNTYFDRDDSDGSACAACGDRCYLKMWRLFYFIAKSKRRLKTKTVLCESCHQVAMEE